MLAGRPERAPCPLAVHLSRGASGTCGSPTVAPLAHGAIGRQDMSGSAQVMVEIGVAGVIALVSYVGGLARKRVRRGHQTTGGL